MTTEASSIERKGSFGNGIGGCGQQETLHSIEDKRDSIHSGQSSLSSSNGTTTSEELRQQMCSNADYDRIRNTTLMFFLDRLFIASKDGKEARTLHDLSCLFGTKDFTKEMRQIVGASRNGLKKFLQSYPSLFTIEGDKVYLTQLKQDSNLTVRDYNKEAVEYFTNKLQQFGPSLVPIKNLFGYRSQASQEVRHVSGRNVKEFEQFLSKNEDVFEILNEEQVVLKSAMKELELNGKKNLVSLQQQSLPSDDSVMDPYLNKQFAHFIEDCMKKMIQKEVIDPKTNSCEKVTIQYLHDKISSECDNQLFLNMVKTIEDLKVFLRMHPKIFKRFKNANNNEEDLDCVSLLNDEERKEFEQSTYPSLLMRKHSTLRRSETNESSLSNMTDGPKSLNIQQQHPELQQQQQQPKSMKLSKTMAENSSRDSNEIHKPLARGNSCTQDVNSSLRATAPPFVPSQIQYKHSSRSPDSITDMNSSPKQSQQVQRSHSNLGSSQQHNRDQHHPTRGSILDQRKNIRSYLTKASSINSSTNGLYSVNKQSNGAPAQPKSQLTRQTSGLGEDLRARTVDIVREASNIVSRIMSSTDAVAFDCKGYNLGFNGPITLIQFAFLPKAASTSTPNYLLENNFQNQNENAPPKGKQKPEVCIFDLITNPESAYCLKPLLESEQIVKIVHDVRNKSNALFSQFGIMLNHVFDTQVANLVIQQQETGKPAYKSRYISIDKLCDIYGDDSLAIYRNLIKSKTRLSNNQISSSSSKIKDVNYWKARPLTDAMIYESTMDVYCLIGGVYQSLKSKIKPEYQPLFDQLSLEGVLARIKPDEIRSMKKERKIDLEVIDLKRKLYSDSTSSTVLSNREIRLLRHIDLTEEVRQKIQQCKKVVKKLERLDMKAAQSNQMLESMNSQLSTENEQISLTYATHTSNGGSGSSGSVTGSNHWIHEQRNSNDSNKDQDETDCMTSLMDSSMFDELKDKMIESSSLLESLEDDDDDQVCGEMHLQNQLSSDRTSDECQCNCRRASTTQLDKNDLSIKSISSSSSSHEGKDSSSVETKVVDMAIQCDLLS